MAVGRFTNITQDDHNIAPPEVDAAYDQVPWTAPRIWQDVEANGLTLANGRPGYVSTCFQATIKLAAIQNSVLRKLYALLSLKPLHRVHKLITFSPATLYDLMSAHRLNCKQ